LIPAWIAQHEKKGRVGESIPGRAFFLFSMGAAFVGLGSPILFAIPVEAWGMGSPLRLFPLFAAGLLALGLGPLRLGIPLALVTFLGLGSLLPRTPLLWEARNFDPVGSGRLVLAEKTDRITTASVVLDRVGGERFLYTDEFSAAGGLESRYMEALGLLPVWLSEKRSESGEVAFACLGLGTGRTAAALLEANRRGKTWIVEISPAVASQLPLFLDASRIREAFARAGALETLLLDGRFFLERAQEGSLGGITLEPLLPQAPGSVFLYSIGFYRAGKRALAKGGVLVQWVPTHALPLRGFRSLLRTFQKGFQRPRLLLVQESSLLLGKKGGLEGGIPSRSALGDRAAFLSGLFGRLDLVLAELPFPIEDGGDLIDEERPFLERMGFESSKERLGWLAGNLQFLQAIGRKRSKKQDFRSWVQRERLGARILLARRFEDPNLDRSGMAAMRLTKLRESFPFSTLLLREERKARFLQERDRAWRALLSGNPGEAKKASERALRLGPCDPVLLSTRAAAILEIQGKKGAEKVLKELLHFYPDLQKLRAIRKREKLGFAPLLEALTNLHSPKKSGDPSLPLEGFFEAMDRGVPEAWIAFRRRPIDGMWTLIQGLRGGKSLGISALRRIGPYLDPASLTLLEPWMGKSPQNLLNLAQVLPGDLYPSPWMRKKMCRSEKGFELFLRLVERKNCPWALHVLLDLLSSPELGRSRKIRCSLAWQRLNPGSPPLPPSASKKAITRWVQAQKMGLPPTWNHGFSHQKRFLEWK
jgi:spermidine synthase